MTDHERGAYTPQTDGTLSFDARGPRERRPAPFTLIFSGVVLVALVVAVALFYRGGVRGADQAPQTVGEPVVAVREPAPVPAKAAEEDAVAEQLSVYVEKDEPTPAEATAAAAVAAPPRFTAPPEEPQPRPAPRPVEVAKAETPVRTAPRRFEEQPAPAAPAPVAARPTPAAPTPAPALRPAQPAPAVAATTTSVARTTPASPPPAATSGGSFGVQIGAYGTTALADSEYSKVAGGFPGPLAGKSKVVQPVERNGATLYRTIVSGFGSRDQASAFCGQLKAAGRDCIVRGQ